MTGHVNIFCLYPQIFPPARKICGRIRPKQIEKEIERLTFSLVFVIILAFVEAMKKQRLWISENKICDEA